MRLCAALLLVALAACSEGAARTTTGAPQDASVKDAKTAVDVVEMRDVNAVTAPPVPDAGGEAGPTVPGIDAATATWTWVDVPGSACADGSQTGFAINPSPTPSNGVLIFLEGGGACWDATSCWGPVSTAFYVQTGYTQLAFETDPQVAAIYLLDRTNAANPFQGMNIVYIPYCTGDVFAGNAVTALSYLGVDHVTHWVGYENLSLYLDYIRSTFPSTSRVWLAGDSAGGFGAAINFEHVQHALPSTRVDVLDDSGQPIEPAPGRWTQFITAWNAQLPSGCPGCQTDPGAFVDYYNSTYPTHRFGLISYEYDIVISPFMDISLTTFQRELYALAAHMDTSWPDGHYFIIPGSSHVGLLAPSSELMAWVTAMVTDDPTWASSKPN